MEEKSHRRVLTGITIVGILLGSITMINIPTRPAESLIIQENRFPSRIEDRPGVTSHLFSVSLFARRHLTRVELRYSFLSLDTSIDLDQLNQRTQRHGDLSDQIGEIAALFNHTRDYPASPEILDTQLVLEEQEYDARLYDFSSFFSTSAGPEVAEEALTTHLVLFEDDGTVARYYKGISDYIDQEGTGLRLKSVTILRAPEKEMYYAGGFTDEDVEPIEDRPAMGAVVFDDVSRSSTLGVICDAEHKEGRGRCLQLIRIYVDGEIEQIVPNLVTITM